MKAVLVLFVLLMLGAIVYVIWGKTRATVSLMTSQSKEDLKDSINNFLTHRKYLQISQSDNLMTFAMDKSASCIIAFVLLLIGLLSGILYLVLGGSTKTLTVQFGTLQGQQGWNVRIQGQRSIVNRVRKVVGISQAALSPMPVQAGYPSAAGPAQWQAMPAPAPQAIPVSAPRASAPLPAGAQGAEASVPAQPTAGVDRNCPKCNSTVRAGLRFCQSCGTEMA